MPSLSESQQAEVLTLPEAAASLRVPEEALTALVEDNAIPARKRPRRRAGQKALEEHFLNLPVAVSLVGATGFEPATS
jgi:hypothetical protein